jgi:hypothetical protein
MWLISKVAPLSCVMRHNLKRDSIREDLLDLRSVGWPRRAFVGAAGSNCGIIPFVEEDASGAVTGVVSTGEYVLTGKVV